MDSQFPKFVICKFARIRYSHKLKPVL